MAHKLARRLHNPRGRECGCLPECWCRRTAWGGVLRWYVPKRHHTGTSALWKQTQARRLQG